MKLLDLVRGLIAAAFAYVAGEIVGLLVLDLAEAQGAAYTPTAAVTLHWLFPAAASAVAAVVAVRRRARPSWWAWLALTVAVPTVSGIIIGAQAMGHMVTTTKIVQDVITHVAVAGVIGVTFGSVLNRLRSAADIRRHPRPAS